MDCSESPIVAPRRTAADLTAREGEATVKARSLSLSDAGRRRPATSRVGEGPARRPHGNRSPRRGGPVRCQVRNLRRRLKMRGAATSASRAAPLDAGGVDVMKKNFRETLAREVLLADGAMGTLLVSRGAEPEQAKSPLNLTGSRRRSAKSHDDYRDAGARILTTNTWDANRVKLTDARVGRLAREDQPGRRASRPRGRGRRARVRGRLDRAARARSSSPTAR